MFEDITVEQLLKLRKNDEITVVDVRSPKEFRDATIPGSVNIPLFDDEERKQVGTLYKQVSVEAAKQRGIEIVSRKLPAFINEFKAIPRQIAVFCWRGGMRSKAAATLLSLAGLRVSRLVGGYRSFRRWVVGTLDTFEFKPHAIVLNGLTGSGKTKLLRRLAAEGYPVLDLEAMAGHRGSIFGQVGLEPNNQKTFDSLIALELLELNEQPYVIMEAESRRLGKVCLPSFLMEAKRKGTHLFVDIPAEARVESILSEYEPAKHHQECMAAFSRIKRRIHTPVAAEIERLLGEGAYAGAVALLLRYYYDPRYEHAFRQYDHEPIVCRGNDVEEALAAVKSAIRSLFGSGESSRDRHRHGA